MNDDDFVRAFESGALANSAFHHRDHLRLAWLYLRRDGPERGMEHVLDGIRHFAVAHSAGDRFHETLTRFWVRLMQHLLEAFPGMEHFDDLLARFPAALDKSIVYRHYSTAALGSPAARHGWVAPDLLPLP